MTLNDPQGRAYTRAALELIGVIMIESILYYAADDTPSLHEFCFIAGPAIILAIRNLMKPSPGSIWNGKDERRKADAENGKEVA